MHVWSESTLRIHLNVKELLAQNRCEEFLDIQAIKEFHSKRVCDIMKKHSRTRNV